MIPEPFEIKAVTLLSGESKTKVVCKAENLRLGVFMVDCCRGPSDVDGAVDRALRNSRFAGTLQTLGSRRSVRLRMLFRKRCGTSVGSRSSALRQVQGLPICDES